MQKNILVTSISAKVPMLEAISAAANKIQNQFPNKGSIKVYGTDIDKNCVGRFFVHKFWENSISIDSDDFTIDILLGFCQENNITMIIPSRDQDLLFYSAYKEILKDNGISVMVSKFRTIQTCWDKLLFYRHLQNNKFPSIETSDYIESILTDIFVVKERYGAGSKNIGVGVSKNKALFLANKMTRQIFQPYIEGNEISVDLYVNKEGKCKGVVLRTRDKVVDGESQITTTFRDEKLEKLFSNLAEKLNIYGHAVFQAIIDKEDKLWIIEANARFGGASTVSLENGLDSFYYFILETLNKMLPVFVRRRRAEVKQIRYPKDMFIWL